MTDKAAAVQSYNQELVKCIDHFQTQKTKLSDAIKRDEEEKKKVMKEIELLQEKLAQINCRIEANRLKKMENDKKLEETENGFRKVLESLHILLTYATKETNQTAEKTQ